MLECLFRDFPTRSIATNTLRLTGCGRGSVSSLVWMFAVFLSMSHDLQALLLPEFSAASYAPMTRLVTRLTTGDFNRDGHLDLVALSQGTNLISMLLGLGGAAFDPPMSYQTLVRPNGIAVGDFNKDEKLDIALSGTGLVVMLGDGQGGFSTSIIVRTNSISSLAAADFNNELLFTRRLEINPLSARHAGGSSIRGPLE